MGPKAGFFNSHLFSFTIALCFPFFAKSQQLDLNEFAKREDTLKKFAYPIVFAKTPEQCAPQ
jgi:hypothetical protein